MFNTLKGNELYLLVSKVVTVAMTISDEINTKKTKLILL